MILKKIYLLQQKKYYGYDPSDDENIEEFMIIGYFTSLKTVQLVKNICIENNVEEKTIEVKSYNMTLSNNQKFVYVLSHTYSIKEPDGTFTDFEYIFEPQSSKEKCSKLKENIKIDPKYKFQKNRNYNVCPPDGFFIDKYKLNCIYFPVYKMIEIY